MEVKNDQLNIPIVMAFAIFLSLSRSSCYEQTVKVNTVASIGQKSLGENQSSLLKNGVGMFFLEANMIISSFSGTAKLHT